MHDRFEESTVSLVDLQERFEDERRAVGRAVLRTIWTPAGLAYGENFRCIQELRHQGQEWLARVELPDELVHESQRNTIHPALLDACLHVVFADVHAAWRSRSNLFALPHRSACDSIVSQPKRSGRTFASPQ